MAELNMTDKQQSQANEWIKKQLDEKPKSVGAIGGRFTYSFTPTSLGTIVTVSDNSTKDSLDLTDYSSW